MFEGLMKLLTTCVKKKKIHSSCCEIDIKDNDSPPLTPIKK
jgi:hypothetical protein